MAYVNYMAIDARCVVVEAKLEKSAVDRLSRNTDLRFDELTNRTAVRQIREALGNKQLKDKGTRQGAKWLIKLLTAIFPDTAKDETVAVAAEEKTVHEAVAEAFVAAIEADIKGADLG